MAKKDKETYKDTHGTTRIGDWLRTAAEVGKDIAPELLDIAGDITGIDALNKIAKKIDGSNMPQQDKEIALALIQKDIEDAKQETERQKIAADLEGKIESEITKRWEADASGSWLAKNTRPMIVLAVVAIYLIVFVLDSIETLAINIPASHENIMIMLLLTCVGGYFTVRSVDKYQSFKSKR